MDISDMRKAVKNWDDLDELKQARLLRFAELPLEEMREETDTLLIELIMMGNGILGALEKKLLK